MPETVADWQINVAADTSALRTELQRTSLVGRQFSRSMISAFEGIAVQGRSLGDVVRSLGLSLSRMVLSAAFGAHAGDGIVGELVTSAAQASADDAHGVAGTEAATAEALGECEHVLVAEGRLELGKCAERQAEAEALAVEDGIDFAAVKVGHRVSFRAR